VACKGDIWDLCKIRFKEYSIKYGINKARSNKQQICIVKEKIEIIDKELAKKPSNTTLMNERCC
jgi:hypothetical protein